MADEATAITPTRMSAGQTALLSEESMLSSASWMRRLSALRSVLMTVMLTCSETDSVPLSSVAGFVSAWPSAFSSTPPTAPKPLSIAESARISRPNGR